MSPEKSCERRVVVAFLAGMIAAGGASSRANAQGFDALPPGFRAHVRSTPGGQINWADGEIIAEGRGRAPGYAEQARALAQRAAEVAASRNALLIARGLQVDAEGRFADLRDAEVKLEGVVRGQEIVSAEWFADAVEPEFLVKIRVPIWGAKGVASVAHMAQRQKARQAARVTLPPGEGGAAVDFLYIDARGLGLVPCLYPRIQDEVGHVVYDAADRPSGSVQDAPPIRYVETRLRFEQLLARASFEDRNIAPVATPEAPAAAFAVFPDSFAHFQPAGPALTQPSTQPSTQPASSAPARRGPALRASRASGQAKGDIALPDWEMTRLLQDPRSAGLLRSGRVLVIVDAHSKPKPGLGA